MKSIKKPNLALAVATVPPGAASLQDDEITYYVYFLYF